MIISQYQEYQHFDEIENELVNKLDSLFMSDSKGDDITRAFFVGQLRSLFDQSTVDEQLRERVSSFLHSVDLFLELLLSVRALPDGEEFADDRVIATVRFTASFFVLNFSDVRDTAALDELHPSSRPERDLHQIRASAGQRTSSSHFLEESILKMIFLDAPCLAKFRGGCSDAEAAFGSP